MKNLHKSAWAEVRTEALRNNLAVIRSKLPAGTAVCAVLKADAYGHGMMYRFLSANRLADMAAVGKMKELMTLTALSESGGLPLLLLGPTESDELETCLREGTVKPDRTVFSVYSMRQFDELEALAEKLSLWLTVHIRVDGWDSISPERRPSALCPRPACPGLIQPSVYLVFRGPGGNSRRTRAF